MINKIIFTLLFSLPLAACTLLGKVESSPVHTYMLTLPQSKAPVLKKTSQVTVLLNPVDAAPAYQSTDMIYVDRPYEIKNFSLNRWAAPPAEMLTTLVSEYLATHGCFRAVVVPPFAGETDLTLQTHLVMLQQVFNQDTSQIRMSIAMTLFNNHTQQISAFRRIEVTVPAAASPYGGVAAANKAAEIALSKIREAVCGLSSTSGESLE